MTRTQRRWHLWLWLLLAPLSTAAIVIAVLWRASPD